MKKVLSFVLVLAFCAVLMSVAAFAEPATYSPGNDGTYSIGYTEGTASSYYALLVVEGVYEEGATPVISEDTVLYIDQATADSNGDVTFDGWIPKNDEPATVYLGGTGVDTPVLLGYLGQKTFVVAGTVTSQTTYEATVTLTDTENNVFTGTTIDGAYTVEIPGGTYKIVVTAPGHTSYTKNALEVSADTTFKNVTIKAGDVNYTGEVNAADLNGLLVKFNSADIDCDVNGSGEVNASDLNSLLVNFNALSVVED